VLARDHFISRTDDRLADGGVLELPEVEIDLRRRALDEGEGMDERQRHAIGADLEVLERALSLRAPEAVGRDFDFTHRVGFNPRAHRRRILTSGPSPQQKSPSATNSSNPPPGYPPTATSACPFQTPAQSNRPLTTDH